MTEIKGRETNIKNLTTGGDLVAGHPHSPLAGWKPLGVEIPPVPDAELQDKNKPIPTPAEIDNSTRRTSRRALLTKASLTAAAGLLARREIKNWQSGIETEHGIFIPLYERHDVGVEASRVPENLDYIFLETSSGVIATISELMGSVWGRMPSEKLARNNTKVVFGDVRVDFGAEMGVKTGTALLVALTSLLGSSLEEKITKRRFVGKVTTLWIASFFGLLGGQGVSVTVDQHQRTGLGRLLTRISGISSHLHPEFTHVFFRNCVMALKLLGIAENNYKKSKTKALTGFNTHAGHSGIEDFLLAGDNVCRRVICAYPNPFLQEVIELNGGLDNLVSTRIFTLPKDLKYEDLKDPKKLALVKEERIYDMELKRLLEEKLAS